MMSQVIEIGCLDQNVARKLPLYAETDFLDSRRLDRSLADERGGTTVANRRIELRIQVEIRDRKPVSPVERRSDAAVQRSLAHLCQKPLMIGPCAAQRLAGRPVENTIAAAYNGLGVERKCEPQPRSERKLVHIEKTLATDAPWSEA